MIGDLDGRNLILGGHNPFRRALSYHACQAYAHNNIEGMPPTPYGSPNVKLSHVASEFRLMRSRFDRDVILEEEDEEETENNFELGGEVVVEPGAVLVAAAAGAGEVGGRAKGRRKWRRNRRKGGRGEENV